MALVKGVGECTVEEAMEMVERLWSKMKSVCKGSRIVRSMIEVLSHEICVNIIINNNNLV